MFDFGDDLIIGSHSIPWLIWIQILVMLLLILLLYSFTCFALGLELDPSPTPAAATSPPSAAESSRHLPPPVAAAASSSRLHSSKAGESHTIKGDTGTGTSRRRVRREDIQEGEGGSSSKDTSHASDFDRYFHPCHYFGLAKQAFLKCLGLDPASNDSSNTRHRKEQ